MIFHLKLDLNFKFSSHHHPQICSEGEEELQGESERIESELIVKVGGSKRGKEIHDFFRGIKPIRLDRSAMFSLFFM
jgi:hypothetical protein